MKYYINFPIQHSLIFDRIQKHGYKKINFFIDLLSIAKGLYNRKTIFTELSRYVSDGKPSDLLINEFRDFLNGLFRTYKQYDPFFIIFYDDGICEQNRNFSKTYKFSRHSISQILSDDQELMLFKTIKQYYFNQIKILFEKPDLSKVYYLKQYESDLIPYYCIKNNLFDSNEQNNIINIIFSYDKDLLQCLKFKNTYQYVPKFDVKNRRYTFNLYDKDTAISYIYNKFKRGILTAEYIPLILSFFGDKSDGIEGIKGIGPARAIKLIEECDYGPDFLLNWKNIGLTKLPAIVSDNIDKLIENYKLISFEEQLKRIPENVFEQV